jgi:hypothetical protein
MPWLQNGAADTHDLARGIDGIRLAEAGGIAQCAEIPHDALRPQKGVPGGAGSKLSGSHDVPG